jgi:hypothetical protein
LSQPGSVQREHDDGRWHGGGERVDDQEQLLEGQRGRERGRRGEQLIAAFAGQDRTDEGGGEEVAEVARGAPQGGDLELWEARRGDGGRELDVLVLGEVAKR